MRVNGARCYSDFTKHRCDNKHSGKLLHLWQLLALACAKGKLTPFRPGATIGYGGSEAACRCLLSVPYRKALPKMGRAFQFVDHRDGVILN